MSSNIEIISSERVFAEYRSSIARTVPLSIVDATVGNFSPAGAIWFFDHQAGAAIDYAEHLRVSLRKVLNAYQQWTGDLHWSSYDPDSNDHTKRFRRFCLTWGSDSDPGVEFVTARGTETLASTVPHTKERAKSLKAWDHTNLSLDGFLPPTGLAMRRLRTVPNAPALAVQKTTFACGGVAIGIQMSHPLGDAATLATFVRDWTTISSSMLNGLPVPTISRDFNPQRIDEAAAGNIDASHANQDTIASSRSLPSLRYDWWANDAADCPFPGVKNSSDLSAHDTKYGHQPAEPIPWSQWNLKAPCSAYILHFSGHEVTKIWEAASSPTSTISRHDALLAYLWKLINRGRNLSSTTKAVHINPSLGLRQRLNPPLPSDFIGSPIVMVDVSLTGEEACSLPLTIIAQHVNNTMKQFNPTTVPALLHDMIYSDSPQRIWRGCLGTYHTLVTSWVHLGLYDIDFGLGLGRPRYVEAVLMALDGLLQIMEVGDDVPTEGGNKRHWSDGGVDVSLALEKDAMTRLLQDPLVRQYEEETLS